MKVTFEVIGSKHEIDTSKRDSVIFEKGLLAFRFAPFGIQGCPLTLNFGVTREGKIVHRGYDWSGKGYSSYIQYDENLLDNKKAEVTDAMKETISGLWSGRIEVDGFRIGVGATVQQFIKGIDVEAEEQRCGKKIYLADIKKGGESVLMKDPHKGKRASR